MVTPMISNLIKLHVACNFVQYAKGKQKTIVLKSVCRDPYVERGLTLLLDTLKPFGVREKSLGKTVTTDPTVAYNDILDMCEDLASKKGIGDADIANIQSFLKQIHDPALQIFARDYITKSLALGVAASTFNKALGRRILALPECMLAKKYFEHVDKVTGKSFTVTEKLDGIRAIASVIDGDVSVYSRQGVKIEGLVEIESDMLRLYRKLDQRNFTLDGELLIENRLEYPSKEQYKKTTKIVRKDGEKHGVVYHVFDCMYYQWNDRDIAEEPYSERRRFLEKWCFKEAGIFQYIQLVPSLYSGNDQNMILHHLEVQRAKNNEGVMVNLNDAPYIYGRTANILKVKTMQDCDLEIVGMEEGTGRLKDTLGALIVDYKGAKVGVGTGLTDEDRAMFWSDKNKYIGRVVTIQYFEETCDAKGIPSIRFPVYKELREEGKEVSYS